MLGRIVLPSTLALPFHIALVFLLVSADMWRHRAQHRSTPVKREAVIAGLASDSSAVVGPHTFYFRPDIFSFLENSPIESARELLPEKKTF